MRRNSTRSARSRRHGLRWLRFATAAKDPVLALHFYRSRGIDSSFDRADLPDALDGFEDLAFLFTSSGLNMGIALVALDEGAYLYRLVRSLPPGPIVEIGRYKGGATLLIAAAMNPGSRLYSYDVHEDMPWDRENSGRARDDQLAAVLERYGLRSRVELIVGDSASAPAPTELARLVFVDGDHHYAGARRDFDRWTPLVAPGGHIVFHDANERPLQRVEGAVTTLVAEIREQRGAELEERRAPGTLAHFSRR